MEMITFLFPNSKRTKLIPRKEDWKGYSAYSIGETSSEQENTLQMIKAITYVIQIHDVMTRRNPEYDLTKFEVFDFSDIVDSLGSESIKQARTIVGIKGFACKTPANPKVALKHTPGKHSGYPGFWAEDGSGFYGQIYSIPVLKEKPTELLKSGDIQLIVELMITTMGIEGCRSALLKQENQKEMLAQYVK